MRGLYRLVALLVQIVALCVVVLLAAILAALFLAAVAVMQRLEAAPAPPVRAARVAPLARWAGEWRMGVWQVYLGEGGGCTIHGTDDLYLGRWRALPTGEVEIEECRILDDGECGTPYRYAVARGKEAGELVIVRHLPQREE